MAMPLPWRSAVAKFPACEVRTRETLERDESFDGAPIRGFLWTLFIFKLITVLVIYWVAGGSSEAGILLSATGWPWLIIPGVLLFGWVAFRVRLRRVRSRRLELQRSEWILSGHETMDAHKRPYELDV